MGLNDIDDSIDGIKKFLKKNSDTCFLAKENRKIIGVIMLGNDDIYHIDVSISECGKDIET